MNLQSGRETKVWCCLIGVRPGGECRCVPAERPVQGGHESSHHTVMIRDLWPQPWHHHRYCVHLAYGACRAGVWAVGGGRAGAGARDAEVRGDPSGAAGLRGCPLAPRRQGGRDGAGRSTPPAAAACPSDSPRHVPVHPRPPKQSTCNSSSGSVTCTCVFT